MANLIDTVLLLALPASGKSELRKYMDSLTPDECRTLFHIGATVQLDDYPYVHLMRRIDDELAALGQARLFFQDPTRPFRNPLDWGTLIELLNEDYDDLVARRPIQADSAADWLFNRYDRAGEKADLPKRLAAFDSKIRNELGKKLEADARKLLDAKLANYPSSLEGKTVVIEFARGGPYGAMMPLPMGYGYQYSLSMLSQTILRRAAILHIWVTPEQSRRKNEQRADPNDPGSILHHGVPLEVMLNDYGTDDMEYLITQSGRPDTVKAGKGGEGHFIPVGRFDNRQDKTTFLRQPRAQWAASDVEAVKQELTTAFRHIWSQYLDLHP
ncbi:MAG: hypothetical protein C4523_14970 [Myxococcales bacterium]|nr:MAG: hypothetical protein C4523_14970 [Myxococcales bacterium]